MKVLATILPVFFMIALGAFSRARRLVTAEQAEGLGSVVNTVLFPIMVFNALFTSSFSLSALGVIAFVFCVHLAAMGIGHLLGRVTGGRFAHISEFVMATVDGGNVCYPLYATIVGAEYIGNVVLLDLACLLVVFLVVPVMVSARTAQNADVKALAWNILKNPLVLCIALGLGLNLLGAHTLLETTGLVELYDGIVSMATGPIVACILFNIGFRFKIEKSSVGPLVRCILCRVCIMAAAIALFFLLFPGMAADPAFRIVVPLYFLCPPALVLVSQIEPLYRSKEDGSFVSAFISLYMVVTLAAYTVVALVA